LALTSLFQKECRFFVTSAQALLEKVADPEDVELYRLSLSVGRNISFEQFVTQLVEMGFSREDRVDAPGEMSVRGGIVDIFLYDEENPFRIEFWGDDVESIRTFDVETQKSIDKRSDVNVFPLGCAGPYGSLDERTIMDLAFKKTLFDYLDDSAVLYLENRLLVTSALKDYEYQARVHFQNLVEETAQGDVDYLEYYTDYTVLKKRIDERIVVEVVALEKSQADIHLGIQQNNHYAGNLKLFRKECENLFANHVKPILLVACDSDVQKNRMQELFLEENFPQDIHIETLNLSQGFSWPTRGIFAFTTRELYSRVRIHKLNRVEKRSVSFREELSIKRGDYVVHIDHGVAVFEGLEKIEAYGKIRECLTLSYQDGDKLYVPLEKMDQVQKYSSSEGTIPTLNKLGTGTWEKLKSRTKKRMREITEDLIKLYATRKMRQGFAFSDDTVWQKELEASFQFEETVDQLGAIADVKKDMQKPQPMDRLICGDVGYGKTEVAIRAAFKAINDGKQVAILVPTTILAEQHYSTFSKRLQDFPVNIDVISRFKTPKQQKALLEKLSVGDLDLLVGTHRLLSQDIKFKDLGLLIVDEEQRFGVIHKEKLKLLKQTVDTLTLSATPIPRTMHMAMMGAKDMSIINSPPHNRLPIKTEVSQFDRELIREVILRELDRGGQVFFVHNRVQSIYGISALLNEIIPEAKTAVAHGQMKGHELEKVMLRFIQGDVQVLVSTMIIESGIDLPNANTLIINRADRLGLAQMYQLRGRVGRSNQQAYAYLLIPPMRKITRDAIKRLQTIQEYSELGSGYKIAMRDLEIRGAGNIFGAEQTGFVNALGYELYAKIIQETITEIRRDLNIDVEDIEEEDTFEAKVECAVDAFVPEDYVVSQAERVDIYRRLVKAKKINVIDSIKTELEDRFGAIPEPVENLIDYLHIKMLASKLRLEKVSIRKGILSGDYEYTSVPTGDNFRPWLKKLVEHAPDNFELKHTNDNFGFFMNLPRNKSNLAAAKKFLQSIS
jgi:transcription-repair coupling factor (superfamily II helicase)